MKTSPELITRSGKPNILNHFITNLRENDLHYENNKITQCVFLGVLKLKPIPSVFSENKLTSNKNSSPRYKSKTNKNPFKAISHKYPTNNINRISGKISKNYTETIKSSVKKVAFCKKKSQIIKGKLNMDEVPTSSKEKSNHYVVDTISEQDNIKQSKTPITTVNMQFNPVQNLFDKVKGSSENIESKNEKDSSSTSDVIEKMRDMVFFGEDERSCKSPKNRCIFHNSCFSSPLHSLFNELHTKVSHFTTESPDQIKELFAENNPNEDIIMIDTDAMEIKKKERSSPRFRRVSIMEGNRSKSCMKKSPKYNLDGKNKKVKDSNNAIETVFVDDDYNTVAHNLQTLTCDEDIICLGELKDKQGVVDVQEKSQNSPTKSNKQSLYSKNRSKSGVVLHKYTSEIKNNANTLCCNPNKDVIVISSVTKCNQDQKNTSETNYRSNELNISATETILHEKSLQKCKSRRSRQIPAPIPSIFLQTPRLLRSELAQKNMRKEYEKLTQSKISLKLPKSRDSYSLTEEDKQIEITNVKPNSSSDESTDVTSTKNYKDQLLNQEFSKDTIFSSEEIKSPDQEGKPCLKLIIRQKKKGNSTSVIFKDQNFHKNLEKSTRIESNVEKMQQTASKIDNNEIANESEKTETIFLDEPESLPISTEKAENVEEIIQDLTYDDIPYSVLDIPYSKKMHLSKSTNGVLDLLQKTTDETSPPVPSTDIVTGSVSLQTNKHILNKSSNLICDSKYNTHISVKSSRYLRSYKYKDLFLENNFTSEQKLTQHFNETITIPDELTNVYNTAKTTFDDQDEKSHIKCENHEIVSVIDNESEILKSRVLRSNTANKIMTKSGTNINTNMSKNSDNSIYKKISTNEALSTDLANIARTCEQNILMVQNKLTETVNSDDYFSRSRSLRSHKSRNEMCIQDFQMLIKGNSEVAPLISGQNFPEKKKSNNDSLFAFGQKPLNTSLSKSSNVKSKKQENNKKHTFVSRRLRSNYHSKDPVIDNIHEVVNNTCDLESKQSNIKSFFTENESTCVNKNSSFGTDMFQQKESLKLTNPNINNTQQLLDVKLNHTSLILSVADRNVSNLQENNNCVSNVTSSAYKLLPIKKLRNPNTLRSNVPKEQKTHIKEEANKNFPVDISTDEYICCEDQLEENTFKSSNRHFKTKKNTQKEITLSSTDNENKDNTEQRVKSTETDVMSCKQFYGNDLDDMDKTSFNILDTIEDMNNKNIPETTQSKTIIKSLQRRKIGKSKSNIHVKLEHEIEKKSLDSPKRTHKITRRFTKVSNLTSPSIDNGKFKKNASDVKQSKRKGVHKNSLQSEMKNGSIESTVKVKKNTNKTQMENEIKQGSNKKHKSEKEKNLVINKVQKNSICVEKNQEKEVGKNKNKILCDNKSNMNLVENTLISEKIYQNSYDELNGIEHKEYAFQKQEKIEQKSKKTKSVQRKGMPNIQMKKNNMKRKIRTTGKLKNKIISQNIETAEGKKKYTSLKLNQKKKTHNLKDIKDKHENPRRKKQLTQISNNKQKKKCNDSFDSIQLAEIVNSIQAIEITEQKGGNFYEKSYKNENKSCEDNIIVEEKSWIDISPPLKKKKGRPKKYVNENLEKDYETKVQKQKLNQMSVTQLKTPLKNKLYEEVQVVKKNRNHITCTKRNEDHNSSILESIERVVAGNLLSEKDTTVFDFDDDEYEEPVQLRCKTTQEVIETQKEHENSIRQNLKLMTEDENNMSQKTHNLKSPMKQTTIKEMFQKLAIKKKKMAKSDNINATRHTTNLESTLGGISHSKYEEHCADKNNCQMKAPPRPTKNEEYDDEDDFFDDDSRAEWIPEEYAEYKFKYSAKKLKPLVYRCKICLMTLPTYLRLLKHKQTHVNATNPYECKQCKESFKKVDDLVAHLKVHKGEQPYKCNKCNEGFWTKDEYDRHRPIHILRKLKEAPKKYQCDLCGKAFVKLCDMDRHTRVHTGEKPCICNICGKRFQQSHNLSKHLIIHLHIKPYSCEICSKQFSRPDVLTRHVLTHSVEKPFKCSLCPKTFIRQIQLNKHLQEHSKKSIKKNLNNEAPPNSNVEQQRKVERKKKN